MKSHGTAAGVLALTAALLVGHAFAAEPDKEKDEKKDDVKTLRADLERLKKQVELDGRLNNAELKALTERLDRIEASLEKLNGKTKSRTSSSFTPRAGDTGTLVLDNRMATEAEVTIDGTTYRVPGRSKRTLEDRPAGTFVYEVTATGLGTARKRTVLSKGETLTVRITPPPVTALRVIYDDE